MAHHRNGKIPPKILALFSLLILFFAGLSIVSFFKHYVPPKTVVKVVIQGNIVDEPPSGLSLFSSKSETLKDLLFTLDIASRDARVVGVVVEVKPFDAGVATIQEIRNAIDEINRAGKWTAAYFTDEEQGYYLTSACKEIFMYPTGGVEFHGISITEPFIRDLLDKLGVKPEWEHISPYKTAINILTQKKMTKAQKEMDTWLLDSIYSQLISDISRSRHLTADNLELLMGKGVFLGDEAVRAKLVDKLAYPDEFVNDLKSEHGSFHLLDWNKYFAKARHRYWGKGEKIAIVYASGTIIEGKSGSSLLWGKTLGSDTLSEAFKEVAKDPSIKAVVFRIDSPGGDSTASDIITHEAELVARKIPVVVSMSDVAGSGGYYITTFNPPPIIFADPGTITASIGVLEGKNNWSGFFKKLGITFDSISRGKMAFLESSLFDSPGEEKIAMHGIKYVYAIFVNRVARSRHMTNKAVDQVGGGRVYTGEQAKEKGLVDQMGGLLQAIAAAKQKAGIRQDAPVNIVIFPQPKTFLQTLTENLQSDSNFNFALLWRPEQILMLMKP